MNIHEYQAKALMDRFQVATPFGDVASTPEEAQEIAARLGTNNLVVKAQIHAGGRGKGHFPNRKDVGGGVQLCKTSSQVRDIAKGMLGGVLVTKQTGPEGREVRKVLIAAGSDIENELYFAILLDREHQCPVVVASTEGGMNIEEVAESNPEAIVRELVDPAFGLQPYQSRKLARALGFDSQLMRPACKIMERLYQLFIETDCSMVEINPLVVTKGHDVLALDAKFNFDDNALFRQKEVAAMRDELEEDPREVQASKFGLSYIGLDGNIGCLVNGAGLAMATMDIIQHYGGSPANFLDVGGGATEEQVTEAFKILMGDNKVDAILVNIFGGIMKCDIIAQGVINALRTLEAQEKRIVPLVVRLEGTNVEAGRKLLNESGMQIITGDDIADAAQKVVVAAKG